jgi:hypothetical protein
MAQSGALEAVAVDVDVAVDALGAEGRSYAVDAAAGDALEADPGTEVGGVEVVDHAGQTGAAVGACLAGVIAVFAAIERGVEVHMASVALVAATVVCAYAAAIPACLALALSVDEVTRQALDAEGAVAIELTSQTGGGAGKAEAVLDGEKGEAVGAHCAVGAVIAAVPTGQTGAVIEVEGGLAAEAGVWPSAVARAFTRTTQAGVHQGFVVGASAAGQTDPLGVAGVAGTEGYPAAILSHTEVLLQDVVSGALAAGIIVAAGAVYRAAAARVPALEALEDRNTFVAVCNIARQGHPQPFLHGSHLVRFIRQGRHLEGLCGNQDQRQQGQGQ